MTFTLISVVYACGIAQPGHGSFTPLIVGLTLTACAGTGGRYTGAALNPARVIGPAAVFHCSKNVWWMYVLAEVLAAALACGVFAFVSGWGPLSPLKSMKEFGLSHAEAIRMWVQGTPPERFRTNKDDNIEVCRRRRGRCTCCAAGACLRAPDTRGKVPGKNACLCICSSSSKHE